MCKYMVSMRWPNFQYTAWNVSKYSVIGQITASIVNTYPLNLHSFFRIFTQLLMKVLIILENLFGYLLYVHATIYDNKVWDA